MSVVGIDFGAQSTKIGVARNKGIDIVSILWIFFFFFFWLSSISFNVASLESLKLTFASRQIFRLAMRFLVDRHRKFHIRLLFLFCETRN